MAKRKRSASVKEAADRAARKSAGVEETEPRVPIDPPVHAVHPGGRPTDYNPEFCQIAADACARGATDEEIADLLDVSARTVYRWKLQHPAFCQAIDVGKELCDQRVERSMYARAVGYTYDSVKILQNAGVPLVVPYKEHVPPDVAAQKHWLGNRRPDKWREVSKHEHSGSIATVTDISGSDAIEQARSVAFAMGRALERQRMKVIDHDAS